MDVKRSSIPLREASRMLNLTLQALYAAQRCGKLKASKIGGHWVVNPDDLIEYCEKRYIRDPVDSSGAKVFDAKKGTCSIEQASRLFRVPYNHIYYLIRNDKISFTKHRSSYVLNINELKEVLANEN